MLLEHFQLSQGQTQVSPYFTIEAQFVPGQAQIVPGTIPGTKGGRKSYASKIYVPFSLATNDTPKCFPSDCECDRKSLAIRDSVNTLGQTQYCDLMHRHRHCDSNHHQWRFEQLEFQIANRAILSCDLNLFYSDLGEILVICQEMHIDP